MKVLGIVTKIKSDRNQRPIAWVAPICRFTATGQTKINAPVEFPSQGLVFWPEALTAKPWDLVLFEPHENNRAEFSDKFTVEDASTPDEVLDLRNVGDAVDVHLYFTGKLSKNFPSGKVFVRCKPDILVGPVLVSPNSTTYPLVAPQLHDLPVYDAAKVDIRRVQATAADQREIVLRLPPTPVSRVDWSEPKYVVKRTLEVVMNGSLSQKTFKEIAERLAMQSATAEGGLSDYRLRFSQRIASSTNTIAPLLLFAEVLSTRPDIVAEIEKHKERAKNDTIEATREELKKEHASKRLEVQNEQKRLDEIRRQKDQTQKELDGIKNELDKARAEIQEKVKAVEAEVSLQLQEVLKKPEKLIAEVAILRSALIPSPASNAAQHSGVARTSLSWTDKRTPLADQLTDLKSALFSMFKARGLNPTESIHIHAAIVGGLVPIVAGSMSLVALMAYADVTCGGRCQVYHVSPSTFEPSDLLFRNASSYRIGDSSVDFREVVDAANRASGMCLVILEGCNRAPTESYLLPLLQQLSFNTQILASDGTPVLIPKNLRLAATLVEGPTSLPISRDIWGHCAALGVLPAQAETQPIITPGITELSAASGLMQPGDGQTPVADDLVSDYAEGAGFRKALARLERGIMKTYGDQNRVRYHLLENILLPTAVTLKPGTDRDQEIELVLNLVKAEDQKAKLKAMAKRYLRSLA